MQFFLKNFIIYPRRSNMTKGTWLARIAVIILVTAFAVGLMISGCDQKQPAPAGDKKAEAPAGDKKADNKPSAGSLGSDAASKVYVAPGKYDEFYAFMSGGFSGQLTVHGLPSGRIFKVIPVFSQNPENGYGYDEESKDMLNTSYGHIPWDDSHHPKLSQTDGKQDGRWIFINANNTPRIARISLKTFETEEIIELPNTSGNHASPFLTMNTEYVVGATRFSVPVPATATPPVSKYKEEFKGIFSFVKVAKDTGRMSVAFQYIAPGYDYDVAHCGKGPSKDWCFFSSYNTEQAVTAKEANALQNDKDFIVAINWKKMESCAADGKGKKSDAEYFHNVLDEKSRQVKSSPLKGVPMLTGDDCPGSIFYLPTPKSPHGVDVDPTGEYIVGGGKLSAEIPVHSYTKMVKAIEDKAVEKTIDGIPVLKFEAINAALVQKGVEDKKKACSGPLHTEFDDKGYAYTSCFLSSNVIKWKVGEWKVVDSIPTYYNIGHLLIPGGDTMKPSGKYLVAMNKVTKDRYLPTGPELVHAAQLIDISGDKMQLLLDFPERGEPHYAQAAPASVIETSLNDPKKTAKVYSLDENNHPYVAKKHEDAKVEKKGNEVHVNMTAVQTRFVPDIIDPDTPYKSDKAEIKSPTIKVGDTVFFHVTNIQKEWDVPHGFAVKGAQNAELLVMPGETRTLKWKPTKPGVYPFYCTDFCSPLHQEMQGYIRVLP